MLCWEIDDETRHSWQLHILWRFMAIVMPYIIEVSQPYTNYTNRLQKLNAPFVLKNITWIGDMKSHIAASQVA